jgi:hypothetical protein
MIQTYATDHGTFSNSLFCHLILSENISSDEANNLL